MNQEEFFGYESIEAWRADRDRYLDECWAERWAE